MRLMLLFFIIIIFSSHLAAQVQWQLVKEKNGIQVYTAGREGSDYKSIKVTALMKGTCQKLVAIFEDIGKQPQWVYAAKKAYLISKQTENELLYYVETALPWPATNRDIAVEMKIEQNQSEEAVSIISTGKPDAIPPTNGKVRVVHYQANLQARAVGYDKIQIEYTLDFDPGGTLPAWITNLFVTKGPYETFSKLSQLLSDE